MSSGLSYDSIANRTQPHPTVQEVEVDFNMADSLFKDYTEEFSNALLSKASLLVDDVKVKGLKALIQIYLTILLMFRIDYVNNKRIPIRPKDNDLAIPKFFSNILEQVGKVDASKYGIVLIPRFLGSPKLIWERAFKILNVEEESFDLQFTTEDVEDEETQAKVSNQFDKNGIPSLELQARWINKATLQLKRVFTQTNVKPGVCLPVSSTGTLDFMVLQCTDKVVYANRDDIHPLFALYAAVVGMHQKAGVFFPGINYGTFAQLRQGVNLAAQLDVDGKEK